MIQGNNRGNYVKRNLETGEYDIFLCHAVLVTVSR